MKSFVPIGKGKIVSLRITAAVTDARLGKKGNGAEEFSAMYDVPASLDDAIKIYGEDRVFEAFTSTLVISLQAHLRDSIIKQKRGTGKKRMSWADKIAEKR